MAGPKIAPLVVIVGETGSGKTELAIKLAKKLNGEIICADSRTVYEGMDIGTAKPTPEERAEVPHHLLDVAKPDEEFTVADFKRLANEAIRDIKAKGKLPIMAGGSGLYIDSVLYDYEFRDRPTREAKEEREALAGKTVEELQKLLEDKGIPLPNNPQNPRHLIRTLETGGRVAGKGPMRANTLVVGLSMPREELRRRIARRVDLMIEKGLIEEIEGLARQYGWHAKALQAPAYRAFKGYIEGSESLDSAKENFIKNDLALAKRQRTWFKRNKSIQWFTTPVKLDAIVDLATTLLKKSYS